MSNNVKKQHYIPRFYLSTFATNKQIRVHDKNADKHKNPKSLFYLSNIENVGCENYFYDIGELGKRNDFAEKAFSKLESVLAPSYKDSLVQLESKIAPNEHIKDLATLIASTLLRSKERREWLLNSMLKSANLLFKHPSMQEKMRGSLQEKDPRLTVDSAQELLDMLKLEINPEVEARLHLGMFFQDLSMLESITHSILNRDWYVLNFKQDMNYGFWISDTPVVLFSNIDTGPYGLGMWTSNTSIAFPLSLKYCLFLVGKGLTKDPSIKRSINIAPCSKGMVDRLNALQYNQSHRFVYLCTSNTFLLRRIIDDRWQGT